MAELAQRARHLADITEVWYVADVKFEVKFVPSAIEDSDYYRAREQRIILDAIERSLQSDADVESKRRKRLRPNPLAP